MQAVQSAALPQRNAGVVGARTQPNTKMTAQAGTPKIYCWCVVAHVQRGTCTRLHTIPRPWAASW